MSIFFDTDHELRSGWKFLIFVFTLVLFFFLAALAVSLLIPNDFLLEHQFGINEAAQIFAAVGATIFAARLVDHKPLSSYGISLHPAWARDFLVGIVIAAGMLLVTLLGCIALGTTQILWNGLSMFSAILVWTLLLLAAAAFEEIVFRGFPLQVLMRGIGTWPAVAVMSVLFGLVHLGNPNASALGIINTILAGGLLSAAYLKTRSLWFPYGIHFAWNAGLGVVLGFAVSGVDIASLWTTTVEGREILLGGGYGPEGGIVGTIAFAAGLGLIRFWKHRKNNLEI